MFRKIASAAGVVMVLVSACLPATVGAAGSVGDVGIWQATAALPVPGISETAATSYNSYAYVVGGAGTGAGSWTADVYYGHIESDGSIGSWQTITNSLPVATNSAAAVAYNGYLYVIGGDSSGGILDSVHYASLNSDGSLGAWQTASTLPTGLGDTGAVVMGGYLYLIGGNDGSTNLSTVYYAKLNSDGSLGAWQTASNSIPSASQFMSAAAYNGYIYAIDTSGGNPVAYAKVTGDGSLGAWAVAANQPTFHFFQSVASANGYLYVYGGNQGIMSTDAVQVAQLNSDGSIGPWTTSLNTLNTANMFMAGFVANGYIYGVGGQDSPGNGVQYAPLEHTDELLVSGTTGSVAISTPLGTNITCSSAVTEASLAQPDSGYSYPLGLVKYCFTANDLNSQVSVVFETDLSPSQVVARHYNETTGQYQDISGASITQTTHNGHAALQLTYTIKDGGPLDQDGIENGLITDPVGLAVAVSGVTAPNTGYGAPQSDNLAVFLITAGTASLCWTLWRYRNAQF